MRPNWMLAMGCAAGLCAAGAAPRAMEASAMGEACLRCDRGGYVRHWAIAGPKRSPFVGKPGSDDELRRQAVDPALVPPPGDAALGRTGPFGEPWRFYWPGENQFVEQSAFYHKLETLDLYAVTEIDVPVARTVPMRFWSIGTADLWVNGAHLKRLSVPKYMYPSAETVEVPLAAGANRVAVRLQSLGLRDTRVLFGLQALDGSDALSIRVPGPAGCTAALVAAEGWLQGVRAAGRDALTAAGPAPDGVVVRTGKEGRSWPAGERRFSFAPGDGFGLAVKVAAAGQTLDRALEIPANRPVEPAAPASVDANRRQHLERLAEGRGTGTMDGTRVLARRMLGRPDAKLDAEVLEKSLKFVSERNDCADFTLALLLRMYSLKALPGDFAERVRQTAIDFRYWSDEKGTDAMCFGSENHSLLFHGCQLVAGRLFPEATFPAAGKTGAEQARIGADRCRKWLDHVEKRSGYSEFLSSTYMPITVAALMNVVDFSGDEDLSRRAARQVDKILRDLGTHSFDGVNVAPQGRVYRGVLYPQTSSAQGLLAYLNPKAEAKYDGWTMFVASSPAYQPPADIEALMDAPASKVYREGDVEICLEKTAGFMMNSLRVPASFAGGFQPGKAGYQQHLWHATLGRDCHVFVNHPGTTFDLTMARPGYWYGNGILPRLRQDGDILREVFDVPESHPVHFTHAHWPSDAMAREEVREHWAFGQAGKGFVAFWCSNPLERHDEVLTGRELRAWGRQAAWLCVCGEGTTWDAFVQRCLALAPAFEDGRLKTADGATF